MTFPTLESSITDIETQGDSTTHTVNLNTHATGNLILAFCAVERVGDTATLTTATSGWEAIWSSENFIAGSSNSGVCACYAKIAESASETEPVFTCSETSALWTDVAIVLSGTTTTIGDITTGNDFSNAFDTQNPTQPALTVAGGDNYIIYWMGTTDNDHLSPVSGCTAPNSITYDSALSGQGSQSCHVTAKGTSASSLSSGAWTNGYSGSASTVDSLFLTGVAIPESSAVPIYEQVSFRFRNDDGSLGAL